VDGVVVQIARAGEVRVDHLADLCVALRKPHCLHFNPIAGESLAQLYRLRGFSGPVAALEEDERPSGELFRSVAHLLGLLWERTAESSDPEECCTKQNDVRKSRPT